MSVSKYVPIIVQSLEPDGSLAVGARARVTNGDNVWDGTVIVADDAVPEVWEDVRP